MKKLNVILFTLILFVSISFSNSSSAQVFENKDFQVEIYYGFPNLYTSIIKDHFASNSTQDNVSIGGINPVGLRGEYMLTNKIGIGIDVNYINTNVSWTENFFGIVYDYKITIPQFRAMGKFNLHFLKNDKFDAYGSVALGYSFFNYKLETNDPSYIIDEEPILTPVALRVAVGSRYFFTDTFGVNLEIGAGGDAIFHGGISYKFRQKSTN